MTRISTRLPAPAIEAQGAGDVRSVPSRSDQGLSERLAGGAERDRRRAMAPSPPRSFTRTWPALPTSRASTTRWWAKAKTGSGCPEPKGPARSSAATSSGCAPAAVRRRVDGEGVEALRVADGVGEALADKGLEAVELGRRDRDAGRHGVAAALAGEPGLDGRRARRGRDRRPAPSGPTRSPLPSGPRVKAKAGRRKRSFRRAADEPDDARMPSRRAGVTTTGVGRLDPAKRACASASATAACSIAWRSRLRRSSSAGGAPASTASSSSSSREPSAASPMRPPALMRGPTR